MIALLIALSSTWNPAWTPVLNDEVIANLSQLEEAKDIVDYCPSYTLLTDQKRILVWSRLSKDIAYYESGFDPNSVYHEPPPLNIDSIGLFQLSKEDNWSWCNEDNLKDPISNIGCAIPEMAKLISEDKIIAKGSSIYLAKGLSRYWSTIWTGSHGHNAQIKKDLKAFCQTL